MRYMISLLILLLSTDVLAADAVAIMTEALDSGDAKTTIATMDMTLRSAKGGEQPRVLKMEQLGTDKQLMWFISPNDLRGTAFLQVKDGDDERMWLYMPAFKVTNRISGKRKTDSFMGSEFTYEDMAAKKVKDYSFTYLKEESWEGKKIHVIEAKLLRKDTAYSKSVFYVDEEHKEIQKAEMYGKNGELVKVMQNHKIDVIDGRRIPTRMTMKNVVDGDETEILMREIEIDTAIPEDHFTERYMQRVK